MEDTMIGQQRRAPKRGRVRSAPGYKFPESIEAMLSWSHASERLEQARYLCGSINTSAPPITRLQLVISSRTRVRSRPAHARPGQGCLDQDWSRVSRVSRKPAG